MPEAKDFATATAPLCAGPDTDPRGPTRYEVSAGAVGTRAHVIGLPHISIKPPMPENGELLDLLADRVPDQGQQKRVLADNPHRLYRSSDKH